MYHGYMLGSGVDEVGRRMGLIAAWCFLSSVGVVDEENNCGSTKKRKSEVFGEGHHREAPRATEVLTPATLMVWSDSRRMLCSWRHQKNEQNQPIRLARRRR